VTYMLENKGFDVKIYVQSAFERSQKQERGWGSVGDYGTQKGGLPFDYAEGVGV